MTRAEVSEIDVAALERAGEALLRLRRTQEAIPVLALGLRLRHDLGLLPRIRYVTPDPGSLLDPQRGGSANV